MILGMQVRTAYPAAFDVEDQLAPLRNGRRQIDDVECAADAADRPQRDTSAASTQRNASAVRSFNVA